MQTPIYLNSHKHYSSETGNKISEYSLKIHFIDLCLLVSRQKTNKKSIKIKRTHRFHPTSNYTITVLLPLTHASHSLWQFWLFTSKSCVFIWKGHSSYTQIHMHLKSRLANRLLWVYDVVVCAVIVWLTIKTTVSISLCFWMHEFRCAANIVHIKYISSFDTNWLIIVFFC